MVVAMVVGLSVACPDFTACFFSGVNARCLNCDGFGIFHSSTTVGILRLFGGFSPPIAKPNATAMSHEMKRIRCT